MLAPQKESIFGCSCRLWLLSWRRARVFARSCSLLSKYLPISWKQRKEQSHAQCHVTHRIRIFDKISEHVKVAISVDIAVPELAVTKFLKNCPYDFHEFLHSHSTPKEAPPACAKASKSYGWDVRNIAKISPKMAKNSHFSTFFDFLKNCPYDSNENFYSYSTPY